MNSNCYEKKIELLAKVLDRENNTGYNQSEDALKNIQSYLEGEFFKVVNESEYPMADYMYMEILRALDENNIFKSLNELSGKTLIGIYSAGKLNKESLIWHLFGDDVCKLIQHIQDIPFVFANKKGISLLTSADSIQELTKDECDNLLALRYDKILLNKIINALVVPQVFNLENVVFCYFPRYALQNEWTKKLFNKLNVLCIVDQGEFEKEVYDLPVVNGLINKFRSSDKEIVYLSSNSVGSNQINGCKVVAVDSFSTFFKTYNNTVDNIDLALHLEQLLVDVRLYYKNRKEELSRDVKIATSDIATMSQSDISEDIKYLRDELKREIQETDEDKGLLISGLENLEKYVKQYVDSLLSKEDILLCENSILKCASLVKGYIELRMIDKARYYLEILNRAHYLYAYVYEIYVSDALFSTLPNELLSRLKDEVSSAEEVLHAKILYRQQLNLNESVCKSLAIELNKQNKLRTADEFYFMGLSSEEKSNSKLANKYYKVAVQLGSEAAEKRILSYASVDEDIFRFLANNLNPSACYHYGMNARQNKKYKYGNLYLKLSASKEYFPAICCLAKDGVYRIDQYDMDDDFIDNVLKTLEYIVDRDSSQKWAYYDLGKIYKILGYEYEAIKYWEKAKSGPAYYAIGKLYQYHDSPVGQDLEKAKNYFWKAHLEGHPKGKGEYDRVTGWIENNRYQREQEWGSRSYGSRVVHHEEKESSSGGCFISTATCQTLGKPDDCEELQILREFRDTMRSNPLVNQFIDEYYRTAPIIVERINRDIDSSLIYQGLWEKYISKTCEMVSQGKYKEAVNVYAELVQKLCLKYDILLSDETINNLKKFKGEIEGYH